MTKVYRKHSKQLWITFSIISLFLLTRVYIWFNPPVDFNTGVYRDVNTDEWGWDPKRINVNFAIPIWSSRYERPGFGELLHFITDDSAKGKEKIFEAFGNFSSQFVSMGNQMRNTYKGIKDGWVNGYTMVGGQRVNIDELRDKIQAVGVGPWQTRPAQKQLERNKQYESKKVGSKLSIEAGKNVDFLGNAIEGTKDALGNITQNTDNTMEQLLRNIGSLLGR